MLPSRPLVAIDIGSSSIKVLEMTGGREKKVQSVGLELLPPGTVQDGEILNPDVLEDIARDLVLKQLKISTLGRKAAISLGGSSVMIKKIDISRPDDDSELAEQVYHEAEQHFQQDLESLSWEWRELPPDSDDPKMSSVLLVGARLDALDPYLNLVRALGMKTAVVDCDVFSLTNMFEYNYGLSEGVVAILNVGASVSQLSLTQNGEYLYSRDISIGGREYSNCLSQALGVDFDNAESLKVGASIGEGSVPDQLHTALAQINQQMVSEVQVTLDFFLQAFHGASLQQLYLTGGGSKILGLDAALASSLQLPVKIVNPFHRVTINPRKFNMDYVLMHGHIYGVAVGLGLREVGDEDS